MAVQQRGRGGVARCDLTGGPWCGAGRNRHRWPVAVTEEAHGKRLGISREGLMAGPHVAASEREREREKTGG
jgi:hypothetical protein